MRENLSSRLGKGECGCDDRCRRGAFLHWKLRICHWVSLTQLSPATSFLRHLLSCTCFDLASFAWHLIAVIFFFCTVSHGHGSSTGSNVRGQLSGTVATGLRHKRWVAYKVDTHFTAHLHTDVTQWLMIWMNQITAPRVFTIAWNLLKPFLHERTKNKVSIYGSDSAAWKAAILQDVDADQLPVFYGGTMTDPDGNPQCLTKVSGATAIGCLYVTW